MSVNFVVVHDRKPWRKHSRHKTLHAAIDGNDGAKNLLLRLGRVAGMWLKYGDVHCVFVWEDDAEFGHIFRLDPERSGIVQSALIVIDRILLFQKNKKCSASDILECFGEKTLQIKGDTTDPILNSATPLPLVDRLYPDNLPENGMYAEGAGEQVVVNRFERSREARNACIAHYGSACQVCEISFGEKYGELGTGFIHIHHRVPIASVGMEYCVDPVNDLIPVCPNCHAMLHRCDPPLEVEELQALLNKG